MFVSLVEEQFQANKQQKKEDDTDGKIADVSPTLRYS